MFFNSVTMYVAEQMALHVKEATLDMAAGPAVDLWTPQQANNLAPLETDML
jgi:hypothetical protein